MLVAVAWTGSAVVRRRLDASSRHSAERFALAGMAIVIAVVTAFFAVAAADTEQPTPRLARQLAAVVRPTYGALVASPSGRDGRYLVTFNDPISLGSQAFALVNELERQGLDVGMIAAYRSPATTHRVLEPAHASAIVHLAVGPDIAHWRSKSEAHEVAYSDVRTKAQRQEYARLRTEVVAELQQAGRARDAKHVDEELFRLTLDQHVPSAIRKKLGHMDDLGMPIAIFVAPRTVTD
jgi:hypothetical protein